MKEQVPGSVSSLCKAHQMGTPRRRNVRAGELPRAFRSRRLSVTSRKLESSERSPDSSSHWSELSRVWTVQLVSSCVPVSSFSSRFFVRVVLFSAEMDVCPTIHRTAIRRHERATFDVAHFERKVQHVSEAQRFPS